MALRDPDIRAPLRHWIRANRAPGLLADELPLREGRSLADLALIVERLHAFEIKGDTDDMRRLENQVKIFGGIVHTATMVTTKKHIGKMDDHLPEWWGLILAKRDDHGQVTFEQHRQGQANPGQEFRSLSLMLRKREILGILEEQGKIVKSSTPKSLLLLKLKEVFDASVEDLWPAVLESLLERENDPEWRHYHLKD